MNKTRKAIIEIIEPYMDKSLEFGCLLKHNSQWDIVRYIGDNNLYWKSWLWDYDSEDEIYFFNTIIWHYDITSLIKYIVGTWRFYGWDSCWITPYIIEFQYNDWTAKEYESIPNKPLHLYTEQEEKGLLELITKLK